MIGLFIYCHPWWAWTALDITSETGNRFMFEITGSLFSFEAKIWIGNGKNYKWYQHDQMGLWEVDRINKPRLLLTYEIKDEPQFFPNIFLITAPAFFLCWKFTPWPHVLSTCQNIHIFFCDRYLNLRKSAHASRTLESWRKDAPTRRLWTLAPSILTLPE